MEPDPHYVRDYSRLVAELTRSLPLDEAMERAVGGDYESVGQIEADILEALGFKCGHSIIDLGCGSGRLASQLASRFGSSIAYLGIDVVPELIKYAATKCPPDYVFRLNQTLDLPVPKASADFIVAFSVFTHLWPSETYRYLVEARRALRPGGMLVFSFLELFRHRAIFVQTISTALSGRGPHVTMFLPRLLIRAWAKWLRLEIVIIEARPNFQTIAVLRSVDNSKPLNSLTLRDTPIARGLGESAPGQVPRALRAARPRNRRQP